MRFFCIQSCIKTYLISLLFLVSESHLLAQLATVSDTTNVPCHKSLDSYRNSLGNENLKATRQFFFLFFQHYLWLTEFVKFTYESWVPTYMWPPYLFKCKWIWWYFISSILYVSKEGSSFQFTMHDQKIQFSFNNFVPCLLKNVKVKLLLNGAWRSPTLLENVEWNNLPSLQYWNRDLVYSWEDRHGRHFVRWTVRFLYIMVSYYSSDIDAT